VTQKKIVLPMKSLTNPVMKRDKRWKPVVMIPVIIV
jgi:hypothetical protein